MKQNYIADAWLVILLSTVFGAALAQIHVAWQPKIEENRLNDSLAQIPQLVPGSTRGERVEVGGAPVYRAIDSAQATVGWVVPAGGQGFADRIELLVAVDRAAARVTGLYVLAQKETPGLGDKIRDATWRGQFIEKATEPALKVVKRKAAQPNEIEALTGATISSDAVTMAINEAMKKFRQDLAANPM